MPQEQAPASSGEAVAARGLRGAGLALESGLRAPMERRFGQDLSRVRIHVDGPAQESALDLRARAYTVGTDVVLPSFPPASPDDWRLLAHELAHVVQQTGRSSSGTGQHALAARGTSEDDTAESAARAVAEGADAHGLTPTAQRLQRAPLEPAHEGPVTSAQDAALTLGGVTASAWVELHAVALSARVVEILAATPFDLATQNASWTASGQASFLSSMSRDILRPPVLWWNLERVLGKRALVRAVDAGRDCYPSEYGTRAWQPGVAAEIAARLSVRVLESIDRVIGRVAHWEHRRSQQPATPAKPVPAAVAGTLKLPSEPLVIASFSHPIDPFVGSALVGNVAFDWTRWMKAVGQPTPGADERLRRVRLAFQAAYGASSWVRVIEPADATLLEVANELFGDPSHAHRLNDLHPLYGFDEAEVGLGQSVFPYLPTATFRPEHLAAYRASLASKRLTPAVIALDPLSPAQQLLFSPLAEEAALHSAVRIAPRSATSPAGIRQRLTLINDRFAQIRTIAPALAHAPSDPPQIFVFGPQGVVKKPFLSPLEIEWDARLGLAAGRFRWRMERLAAADERDLLLWDTHSAGQLDILNSVLAGVTVAISLARDYAGQPRIHEAVLDVASRYVAAAEISDLYGPAQQQLVAANRQSQLFPVTAMELILADLRAAIDASRTSKVEGQGSNDLIYRLHGLDQREIALRERLARIRPLLLTDPDRAREDLRGIYRELAELQTGVALVGNLDAIDAVWQALHDSITWSSTFRSLFGHYGNDKIIEAMDGANRLWTEWSAVYSVWRRDPQAGLRLLTEKAQSKEWKKWFNDMRALIRDQQQADAWTKFGFMVGIAILTAGIGAYVEAAAGAAWAGAAWGGIATWGVTTTAEAVAFTSMSYLILEKDPSVSGFFAQMGINFLTFGALRGLSWGYRGLVGAEKAITPLGKLGEIGVSFVALNALALAQASHAKGPGRSLTPSEILSISLENLAFVGAVSLGTFLLKSPLIELSLSGELTGAQYRVRRAAARVETELASAKALEAAGRRTDRKGDDRLVAAEDAYVAAERDLLLALGRSVRRADQLPAERRKRLLADLRISDDLAKAVRSGEATQRLGHYIDALTAVRVQRALVPAGAGDFLVAGAQFDMVVEYFRSQGATVQGSDSPFAPAPPGGVSIGLRTAIVEAPGQPRMRIMESAAADPHSVAQATEMLEAPFAQSGREARRLAISRLLLANRSAITSEGPRAGQAREAKAAVDNLRTPLKAQPGDPPPPLEGYLPQAALLENIEAVARLRERVLKDNPDVIVGMERYGALLADMIAYGHPQLKAKVTTLEPVKWAKATSPGTGVKGKFDPVPMQAKFRALLGPDKQVSKTVAVVDSNMGGPTFESLLQQVYEPLATEYPNVRFRNYVLRESFGRKVATGGTTKLPEMRGAPEDHALVTTTKEEVAMIVGDDLKIVFVPGAAEPIRVFDPSGKVVETFVPRPGQTTRELLIELVNGKYDVAPQRPIPDPVGQIKGSIPPDIDDRSAAVPPQPPKVPIPVP